MKPDEIKRWLTEPHGDEWEHYLICQGRISKDPTLEDELIVRFLKSLASARAEIAKKNRIIDSLIETIDRLVEKLRGLKTARAKSEGRRAMLEKHQWYEDDDGDLGCSECGKKYKDPVLNDDGKGCSPDCKLAELVKKEPGPRKDGE